MFTDYYDSSTLDPITNNPTYSLHDRNNQQANTTANYHHWQVSYPNLQGHPTPQINSSNSMNQTLDSGFPQTAVQKGPYSVHLQTQRSCSEVIYTVETHNQNYQFKEGQSNISAIHKLVDDHFTLAQHNPPSRSSELIRSLKPPFCGHQSQNQCLA